MCILSLHATNENIIIVINIIITRYAFTTFLQIKIFLLLNIVSLYQFYG